MKKSALFAVLAAALIATGIIGIASGIQPPTADKPMVMHIHSQLLLNVDGKNIPIPKNIGVTTSLWKNHSLDGYGMQGMSPLHTHSYDGIIHVESNAPKEFTIGDFLNVWGFDTSQITNLTINGEASNADHVLQDKENIVITVARQL